MSRFQSLYWRAQLLRVFGKLTSRSRNLLELDEVRKNKRVEAVHEAGSVTVEVAKIKGSEGRACDFDRDFLPLSEANRDKWASVYAAQMCGVSMPAVSLVQVGNVFYVRDGHHRVSIARMLGQQFIDANVQVWQVEGEPVAAPAMSMQLVSVI